MTTKAKKMTARATLEEALGQQRAVRRDLERERRRFRNRAEADGLLDPEAPAAPGDQGWMPPWLFDQLQVCARTVERLTAQLRLYERAGSEMDDEELRALVLSDPRRVARMLPTVELVVEAGERGLVDGAELEEMAGTPDASSTPDLDHVVGSERGKGALPS